MREVQIGRVYRHFKGDYYVAEAVAHDSETGEAVVIYRKLYDDGGLWVRPTAMFLEPVDKKKYGHEAGLPLRIAGNQERRRALRRGIFSPGARKLRQAVLQWAKKILEETYAGPYFCAI